jgi:hypothetical protein
MPVPLSVEELQNFHGDTLYGEDPYGPPPDIETGAALEPHCIYFIYVGLDKFQLEDVKHYFYDNGPTPLSSAEAQARVEQLASNASINDSVPPQHGYGFKNMIWRRRSYLAFVIDHPVYTTWPGKAIEFNGKDGALRNHTFFNGRGFNVSVKRPGGITEQRSAFMCINYMRNASGDPLPADRPEKFSFALLLRAGNMNEPWKYDPGGTNQGPPVDP